MTQGAQRIDTASTDRGHRHGSRGDQEHTGGGCGNNTEVHLGDSIEVVGQHRTSGECQGQPQGTAGAHELTASRAIMYNTEPELAPRAIRMPISRVRRDTE